MPTRIAATAADTPPAYRRLNNYAQSGRERPARQAICGLPTAGDLVPRAASTNPVLLMRIWQRGGQHLELSNSTGKPDQLPHHEEPGGPHFQVLRPRPPGLTRRSRAKER